MNNLTDHCHGLIRLRELGMRTSDLCTEAITEDFLRHEFIVVVNSATTKDSYDKDGNALPLPWAAFNPCVPAADALRVMLQLK